MRRALHGASTADGASPVPAPFPRSLLGNRNRGSQFAPIVAAAFGCSGAGVHLGGEPPDDTSADDVHTLVDTAPTGFTGDTSATTPSDACAALPMDDSAVAVDLSVQWVGPDFDFDALGRLVTVENDRLVAFAAADVGSEAIGQVGWDVRGVQVDHEGTILVSSYSRGTVSRVNAETGNEQVLIGGMIGAGGLEIGDPDVLYVAETGTSRVFEYDGPAMVAMPIASFSYPTHLALSPGLDVLYVSDLGGYVLWALDREPAGGWSPPRLFAELPEPISAIEVDSCGNLYGVSYWSGYVLRFDPATGEHVRLATLGGGGQGQPGAFSTARWGSDRGPWRRDVLYVSDYYGRLWSVEVGAPGRDQPVDAAP